MFDGGEGLPPLFTDEGKISQILRNLVSNGLKFTERGEVRVSARLDASGDAIVFEVADTGIGIRAEDLPRIFEEFTQPNIVSAPGPRNRTWLPLSKRLRGIAGCDLSDNQRARRG